ncbi:hypothetical protein KY289_024268 [Solanum tuberosum]|nr:hypothetical protein KY289_024268 [Solanum tuberosum]
MNNNEQLININVVSQAPLKLNNTNYQSWKYQWETILTAYDFLHFIEQPPSPIATPFHQRQDHLIRSAIVASLSSDIVPFHFSLCWVQISMDELFLHALHELPAEYDTITATLRA